MAAKKKWEKIADRLRAEFDANELHRVASLILNDRDLMDEEDFDPMIFDVLTAVDFCTFVDGRDEVISLSPAEHHELLASFCKPKRKKKVGKKNEQRNTEELKTDPAVQTMRNPCHRSRQRTGQP